MDSKSTTHSISQGFRNNDAMISFISVIDFNPLALWWICPKIPCFHISAKCFSLVILTIMDPRTACAGQCRELARGSQALGQLGRAPLGDLGVGIDLLLQLDQARCLFGVQQLGTRRESLDHAQHGVGAEVGQSDLEKKKE